MPPQTTEAHSSTFLREATKALRKSSAINGALSAKHFHIQRMIPTFLAAKIGSSGLILPYSDSNLHNERVYRRNTTRMMCLIHPTHQ